MKRTMLAFSLIAGAALTAAAQQSNANDPYQGVSTPPPDDEITTTSAPVVSAPTAKPRPAGQEAPTPTPTPNLSHAKPAAGKVLVQERPTAVKPTATRMAGSSPAKAEKPMVSPAMGAVTEEENGASAVLSPEAERRVNPQQEAARRAEPEYVVHSTAVQTAPRKSYLDDDMVHPETVQAPPRSKQKAVLYTRVAADGPDPDGDIVHPRNLRPTEVEEGSEIRARLEERISTASNTKFDVFRLRVVSDVVRNGNVLIPADSMIEGEITQITDGSMGGRGRMRLTPDTLVMPDGRHYFMRAQIVATPGANVQVGGEGSIVGNTHVKRNEIEVAGAMGTGALAGAALGGPAGAVAGTLIGAGAATLHMMVNRPQAVLEPGTVMVLNLSETLDVDPSKARGVPPYPDTSGNGRP